MPVAKRDLGRVDKTAAIAGDTCRVGGNDLGRFSSDFEDDAHAASGQPGVALYPTTGLFLCASAAVVGIAKNIFNLQTTISDSFCLKNCAIKCKKYFTCIRQRSPCGGNLKCCSLLKIKAAAI